MFGHYFVNDDIGIRVVVIHLPDVLSKPFQFFRILLVKVVIFILATKQVVYCLSLSGTDNQVFSSADHITKAAGNKSFTPSRKDMHNVF